MKWLWGIPRRRGAATSHGGSGAVHIRRGTMFNVLINIWTSYEYALSALYWSPSTVVGANVHTWTTQYHMWTHISVKLAFWGLLMHDSRNNSTFRISRITCRGTTSHEGSFIEDIRSKTMFHVLPHMNTYEHVIWVCYYHMYCYRGICRYINCTIANVN